LEEIREENTELNVLINTNRFKTIKNLENKIKKSKLLNKDLRSELKVTKQSKTKVEAELVKFRDTL